MRDTRHGHARKAIFLTRRTILRDDGPRLALAPGAHTALPLLHASGYRIVVVSNETGIAHGTHTERSLGGVERDLRSLLDAVGAPLSRFLYCPHHPDGSETLYAFNCDCRMPQPGMVLQAAAELKLAPVACWFIGDTLDEVEAAHLAQCRAVLVDDGQELAWETDHVRRPDAIAEDLADAALIIASSARGGIRA
jgi:histidinol-phosphate phosphatase family protein